MTASFLDYTLLKPDATRRDIEKLCREALEAQVFSVCVNPYWVELAYKLLTGSSVKVVSVVGFPLGASLTSAKVYEAKTLASLGAHELDMVMNLGAFKSGDYQSVEEDIRAVVKASSLPIKVIIETCLLTDEEKLLAVDLVLAAGAHFVKTSTGFSSGGATVEDIKLLRNHIGPSFGIKASGGIRDKTQAEALLSAGATRLGSSRLFT